MLPSKHIGKLGSFAFAAVRIQLQAKLIAASAKERYTDTRFASSGGVDMLVMPNSDTKVRICLHTLRCCRLSSAAFKLAALVLSC